MIIFARQPRTFLSRRRRLFRCLPQLIVYGRSICRGFNGKFTRMEVIRLGNLYASLLMSACTHSLTSWSPSSCLQISLISIISQMSMTHLATVFIKFSSCDTAWVVATSLALWNHAASLSTIQVRLNFSVSQRTHVPDILTGITTVSTRSLYIYPNLAQAIYCSWVPIVLTQILRMSKVR